MNDDIYDKHIKFIYLQFLYDNSVLFQSPVDPEPAGRTLHISYVPSTRSKRLVNVFLLIMALLVLSAGIIGGVYIYKYMQHKVSSGLVHLYLYPYIRVFYVHVNLVFACLHQTLICF